MEGEISHSAKFVSQKINKIRWRPVSKHVTLDSNVFATGSWDDEENRVSVWSTEADNDRGDGGPFLLCDAVHKGDVTDLRYVNAKHILASSSLGSVTLYNHHTSSQTLSVLHHWDGIHHFPQHQSSACPCTGLAMRGEEGFVTVGEDGRLLAFSMEHQQPLRVIEKADSCSLNAVLYLKQQEVAAVNGTGQLKVWDLRQQADSPANILLLTGEKHALHCLDKHPTQPHIVMTGGEDGTLCIWDMRQGKFPVTLLNAHSADMWEVHFHPSSPDNLFTCSQDGSVWHWDACAVGTQTFSTKDLSSSKLSASLSLSMPPPTPHSGGSVWLASEATKHRMDIVDVLPGNSMPVNSIDIVSNTLLAATDGEQIINVKNMAIK